MIRALFKKYICPLSFLLMSAAVAQQKSVLDLGLHDFDREPILTLDTNWEFYHKQLLTPENFKTAAPDTLLKPGSWGDVKLHGKNIGNTGYASYRLLLVHVPNRELVLDAYSIQTSFRVFVNGKIAASVGSPGTTKESTVPMNRDVQVSLPLADTIELIVQAANFHHRKGGFVHAFEIGTREAISKQRLIYYLLDFIESSALAILGLFLFALFIFRRKDLSVLYFSLFCITLSFRPVIAVNYLLSTLFNNINWTLMLKMEYLAVLLPCLFMLLFIKKLFPAQLPGVFVKLYSFVLLLMTAVTIFFPPHVFSWLVLPLLFIISSGVVVFAVTIVRAFAAKVEGSGYAGFGLIILLCSLLLKVMVYAGVVEPVHVLITLLDIAFIFSMSLILGSHFSLQFSKVERLQIKTELQHEEIQKQKLEVEKQKDKLEEKNKSIIDSINYARRIQNSLMTSQKYIEKKLRDLNR